MRRRGLPPEFHSSVRGHQCLKLRFVRSLTPAAAVVPAPPPAAAVVPAPPPAQKGVFPWSETISAFPVLL